MLHIFWYFCLEACHNFKHELIWMNGISFKGTYFKIPRDGSNYIFLWMKVAVELRHNLLLWQGHLWKKAHENNKYYKRNLERGRCMSTWGNRGAVLVGITPTYGSNTVCMGVGVCMQAGRADDWGSLAQWGDGGGSWGWGMGKTLWVDITVPL